MQISTDKNYIWNKENTKNIHFSRNVFYAYFLFKKFFQKENEKATLFFRDGKRKIDFVLAYEPHEEDEDEEKKRYRRSTFEKNIVDDGLILEHEDKEVLHVTDLENGVYAWQTRL